MKTFFLIQSILISTLGYSQNVSNDSMKVANDNLDNRVFSTLDEYEQKGIDFMIMRTYDTISLRHNQCLFIYREDTCSKLYGYGFHNDFEVIYKGVGRVGRGSKCVDEIAEIENHLSSITDYFKTDKPTSLDFSLHRYTFYGKINGKYIHETFEESFISSHHSGMLHYVVCAYAGVYCSY
jgi:hypothetical protein